jgi:phage head maturation protease
MTLQLRSYTADLQVRDDDQRTVFGPVVPWQTQARVYEPTVAKVVTETWERGALDGLDPAAIPLTARHPRDAETLPIGVGVEWEARADAQWGAWTIPPTLAGDEVLALVKAGARLGLSIGFIPAPGGSRWSRNRSAVVRIRAAVDHVGVVRKGAFVGAELVGVRHAELPEVRLSLATLARRRR